MRPDFQKSCGYFGGNLADLSKPHIRMFGPHSPLKRKVSIKVLSWVGIGIGAKHVYVRLELEDNSIWNSKEGRWQKCWDDHNSDPDLSHIELETEFILEDGYDKKITNWVRKTVKRYFPLDKYEIIERYESVEPKTWRYRTDGD